MNSIILGNCIDAMAAMPAASVDFILTDPPYLCNYRDRTGRSIKGDIDGSWLLPASVQIVCSPGQDALVLAAAELLERERSDDG